MGQFLMCPISGRIFPTAKPVRTYVRISRRVTFHPIDQAPRPADLAAVERITHHLAPRGPDAWGFHSQGPIASATGV